MARAYVTGDLLLHGVHPGDPYEAMVSLQDHLRFRRRRPPRRWPWSAALGLGNLRPPPPPPQEALPRWRRAVEGLRHSQGPRRRGDPPPLRRLQPVLRAGARAVDDLHLRGLPARRRDPRGGAGREVRPGLPQARPAARPAAARRRLRLGRHGAPRRPRVRRHALGVTLSRAAGVLGQGGDRPGGARRPGRGAAPRLPRRRRVRLRRGQLDRAHRAHRGAQLPGVLRASCATSCAPRGGCSTTASPGTTTAGRTPARSSTATSSPTAS